MTDSNTVRAFLAIIHTQAASVTAGMPEPGLMTLVRVHPESDNVVPQRFLIGDVEGMAKVAIDAAEAGHNVYLETRTVRPGLRGRERGGKGDTVAVFALVRDNDADKGLGGKLGFDTSLVVESSPGNSHDYIFLPPGISPAEADAIGQGMKAATGGDSDTGVITQPYRVAGTLNYPNAKKRARGRVVTPTSILEADGPVWTREQLLAAFPPPAPQERGHIPTGRSGVVDAGVAEIVAERGGDRSNRFHSACIAARVAGMTPDDLEDLMRQHPDGCASKYLKPHDRLRKEIERSWGKIRQRAAADPTYLDNARTSVEAARAELEQLVEEFLAAPPPNVFEKHGGVTRIEQAVRATTGIGKTRICAAKIARWIRDGRLTGPVGYAVPTHRLGEDIAAQFREHGISAEVWRGRNAFISGKSGPTMCDDLAAVKIALDLGAPVQTSCCKGKDPNGETRTCKFYDTCAYQSQRRKRPDVWIFAHDMLFRAQATLSKLSAIFIDESFRDAGTSKPARGVTLDEIDKEVPFGPLGEYREALGRALRRQPGNGGVSRANLEGEGLTAADCTDAANLQWRGKGKPTIWPGMPAKERAAAAKAGSNFRHIRALARIWGAARELLESDDADAVSGRLFIANQKTDDGTVRVVRTRGVRKVAEQYEKVPTFIMDATLPSKPILEKWFPEVEIVGEIEVPMPHVHVRQVLGAPVAMKKLGGAGRNLRAVRRYILRRYVEAGRSEILVIVQKDIETALQATGLPAAVAVEHFNAISGLDEFKHVRLLITVGRTQPEPAAIEEDAGALSGVEPVKAAVTANKSPWFDKVVRGIRLRGGGGVAVVCDQHPDALVEDVRWQICEAELIQAIGRGRGVNRTAETPLSVDILGDVVLPVTVDEVQEWSAPGLEIEMVVEGIWLESPSDMARAWPEVWTTEQVAKDWLRRNTVAFPLIRVLYQGKCYCVRVGRVRYQRAGPKQQWHKGQVDLGVVPDARGWLETRLGPLAGFEIRPVSIAVRAYDPTLAPDFARPGTVRPGPGQEIPWTTPVLEELFLSKEEIARLNAEHPIPEEEKPVPRIWTTPVIEEIFLSPEELARLNALYPVEESV